MNFFSVTLEIGIAGSWFEVTREVYDAFHGPKRIRNLSTGEIYPE